MRSSRRRRQRRWLLQTESGFVRALNAAQPGSCCRKELSFCNTGGVAHQVSADGDGGGVPSHHPAAAAPEAEGAGAADGVWKRHRRCRHLRRWLQSLSFTVCSVACPVLADGAGGVPLSGSLPAPTSSSGMTLTTSFQMSFLLFSSWDQHFHSLLAGCITDLLLQCLGN